MTALAARLAPFAATAVLLASLTACSSSDPAASTTPVAAAPTSSRAVEKADPEILNRTVQGWLGEVDPGLDAPASALDAANVCTYVDAGESEATLERAAKARFADRAEQPLTKKKLKRIVHILSTNYCPRR